MPDAFSSWEPEPTRRGTFSIIITCLSTLGISTWGALHLSIPDQIIGWKRELKRKLFWMLIGLLLPELLISVALGQLFTARDIRDKVNKQLGFPKEHVWCWRLFHALTPRRVSRQSEDDELQGLVKNLHVDDNRIGVKDDSGKIVARSYRWTTAHGFYVMMGGYAIGTQSPHKTTIHGIITPDGFLKLIQEKPELMPEIIPDISEEEISNRGKSDALAKALLVVQIGWFCANCTARLIQNLPLTLLEVSTAAHALCALFVYCVWWNKPLNVGDHTVIARPEANIEMRTGNSFEIEGETTTSLGRKWVRDTAIVFITVGILYGAPHMLAWNASFATHAEQILWRISTMLVTGTPACVSILVFFDLQFEIMNSLPEALVALGVITGVLIYFPSNLYLIAASLRQLAHLPPDAFQLPVWSNYFPHIS